MRFINSGDMWIASSGDWPEPKLGCCLLGSVGKGDGSIGLIKKFERSEM
jgi:hypothetical protein